MTVRASVAGKVVEQKVLLAAAEDDITLPGAPEWVVVNAGGHGFYRVGYAPALLDRLTADLAVLAPIERFGLVCDCFALTQAGGLDAPAFLDLTGRFRDETDRNVWAVMVGAMAYVNRAIDDDARGCLEEFVRDRVGPGRRSPGLGAAAGRGRAHPPAPRGPSPGAGRPRRRPGGPDAGAGAVRRATAPTSGAVDPNVLPALIAILARAGGEAEYEEFLERFRHARSPRRSSATCTRWRRSASRELVTQTLEQTLDGEIRSQDAPYVVRAVLASVWGRGIAWEFVKGHWETMRRTYPPSAFRRLFDGVTRARAPRVGGEVRAFFPAHGIELGGKIREQYLEQLRVAVRFREREAARIAAYLAREMA